MARKKSARNSSVQTNDWIEFKDSGIHGMGGFARCNIAKGKLLIEYTGEKITKAVAAERAAADNPFIFNLNDKFDVDGSVEWNPARFLNHSCEPNATTEIIGNRIWVRALREIRPGEEITYNYCYDLEDHEENPCYCGSAKCVGYMVAEEFFPRLRKRRRTGMPAAAS